MARVHLRAPVLADQREFLASVRRSRALHRPWITAPATPPQFKVFVERIGTSRHACFLVCETGTGAMAGLIHISEIVHGAFRSGYLGYSAFAGFERRGLMKAGMLAVLRVAFRKLKLHRLEANIQPDNAASIALVKSCGFELEGYSPRYLKIRGRWRDHERWAIRAS